MYPHTSNIFSYFLLMKWLQSISCEQRMNNQLCLPFEYYSFTFEVKQAMTLLKHKVMSSNLVVSSVFCITIAAATWRWKSSSMSNNLAVSGVSLSLMQREGGMLWPKIKMLSAPKSMCQLLNQCEASHSVKCKEECVLFHDSFCFMLWRLQTNTIKFNVIVNKDSSWHNGRGVRWCIYTAHKLCWTKTMCILKQSKN